MPKPTRKEISEHRQFLKRQQLYEEYYISYFYRWLNSSYKKAADQIDLDGINSYLQNITTFINDQQLEKLYISLYKSITLDEARIQDELFDGPKMAKKDIIDDFAALMPFSDADKIEAWKKLLDAFIRSRIGQRITQVTETTIKYVQKIISDSIAAGDGAKVTAKKLREKTDFNKNRALAIARTETITAMNQGKYIAALSSKFEMQKRWVPADDKRTRHSHREFLDSDFIDLESLFTVSKRKGGEDVARYPGDETLSAENTVNCRCSIAFKTKRNATGNVIRKI